MKLYTFFLLVIINLNITCSNDQANRKDPFIGKHASKDIQRLNTLPNNHDLEKNNKNHSSEILDETTIDETSCCGWLCKRLCSTSQAK